MRVLRHGVRAELPCEIEDGHEIHAATEKKLLLLICGDVGTAFRQVLILT